MVLPPYFRGYHLPEKSNKQEADVGVRGNDCCEASPNCFKAPDSLPLHTLWQRQER